MNRIEYFLSKYSLSLPWMILSPFSAELRELGRALALLTHSCSRLCLFYPSIFYLSLGGCERLNVCVSRHTLDNFFEFDQLSFLATLWYFLLFLFCRFTTLSSDITAVLAGLENIFHGIVGCQRKPILDYLATFEALSTSVTRLSTRTQIVLW